MVEEHVACVCGAVLGSFWDECQTCEERRERESDEHEAYVQEQECKFLGWVD